jgi:hypothetical protein
MDNLPEISKSHGITDDEFLTDAESEIRHFGKVIGSCIIAIAKKLIEIKERVGHGRYGEFIRDRLPFSERTAQEYVRSYEFLKSAHCSDLGSLKIDISALRLLTRPSTPEGVRMEALARAASAEGISYAGVLRLIGTTRTATSVDAGEGLETRTAEQRPEPVEAFDQHVTQSEPALASYTEIDHTLHSPENTLPKKAAEARRSIIRCAGALHQLTPAEYFQSESGTPLRKRPDLAHDHLGQTANAIAQLNAWCGEFIKLDRKQASSTRSANDADLIPVDDAARLISEPEQPLLPFGAQPAPTPATADPAAAGITANCTCGEPVGSKDNHPRKRKSAVSPAATKQSDTPAGTAATQSEKNSPEPVGAVIPLPL